MLKFTVVAAIFVSCVNALALPKYISTCSQSDPNFEKCAVAAANKAIPSIVNGDKQFGVPSSKPFKVTEVNLSTNSYKLSLKDVEIYGLEKSVCKNIETDFKHVKITMHTDHVKFKGTYEVDGRVLVLPIKGSGPIEIDFYGYDIIYSFDFDKFQKKGVEYAKLKNHNASYKVEKAKFRLDNLFNGDKILGDEVNKLINENWEEIEKDLKDPLSQTIAAVCTSIADTYFTKIPYNDVIRP